MTARTHLTQLPCLIAGAALLLAPTLSLVAQPQANPATSPQAREIILAAVRAELDADTNDHSRWRYRDEETSEKYPNGAVSIVVQTDNGAIRRFISKAGHPLSPEEAQAEDARLNEFIHDPAKIAHQRSNGAQDDKNARELLNMLPDAFIWRIEDENAYATRLHFDPDPNFHPPSLQSRVLSAMSGTIVIDKSQHRIETLSGRLTHDVTFGFGVFGRMREGGTFRIERHEITPGLWQIVETHVHIEGKALLFKSIGQQEDEVQTEWSSVPGNTTLEQAIQLSRPKP
jgi:hypothetical protein